ncbi:MAG: hypothetical protein R3Y10_11960 [Ferrimonas sp.]
MRTTKKLIGLTVASLMMSAGAMATQLSMGEGFFVTAINGNAVPSYAKSHRLSAGKQVVEFRHEKNTIVTNEINDYTVSEPMYVVFNADKTSGDYQLTKANNQLVLTQQKEAVNARFYQPQQLAYRTLAN